MTQILRETAVWCSLARAARAGFRSPELRPPSALLDDPLGYSLDHGAEGPVEAVATVCAARRDLLRTSSESPAGGVPGRVLVTTAVQESVVDGASAVASAGWFDDHDLPPWDTWIAYARIDTRRFTDRFALFAFVPDARSRDVERGMQVNPVDCIEWATEEDMRAFRGRDGG